MTHTLDREELATILAALRYYQQQGLGDPVNRPEAIHDIATDHDAILSSLDDAGIDALCEKLNLDASSSPTAADGPMFTAEELSNQHGFQCPECQSGEQIIIAATHWTQLVPDGTDDSDIKDGSEEWDDNSAARCGACEWSGTVADLITVAMADELGDQP
jgi:hypothetical protein